MCGVSMTFSLFSILNVKLTLVKAIINPTSVAYNDSATVKALSSTTIDVLANDKIYNDPFNCYTKIKVGDKVLDKVGQSVTLESGATVTLTKNNKLVYDTNGAYDDLLKCLSETDSFTYQIVDKNGKLSQAATVTVDVKGESISLAAINKSLPATIDFTITDHNVPAGVSNEAFSVAFGSSSDARLSGLNFDNAYCLAAYKAFVDDVPLSGNLYIADAAFVPDGVLTAATEANLDVINWILNQDFTSIDNGDGKGATYTDAEVQGAIWGLTDNFVYVAPGGGTKANAQEILNKALVQGEGFVAGKGDIVGLVIAPTAESQAKGHYQPFIVGVEYDDLLLDCDKSSCGDHGGGHGGGWGGWGGWGWGWGC